MGTRRSHIVDYQQRATEFALGDVVYHLVARPYIEGRVQAVWPAIGMVDVEWPSGSQRVPVEELQRKAGPPLTENIPGGAGTVPVSVPHSTDIQIADISSEDGSEIKTQKVALYWAAPDRHYRATQEEATGASYLCPKCKESVLVPTTYKRVEGASERLLACPVCLFLIRRGDIIGHPEYVDDGLPGVQAGKKAGGK